MNVPKDNSTSNKAWIDHEIILPKSNSIDTTSTHQTCSCTGIMSTKQPQQKHPEEEEDDDDDELPPHILRWKNLIVPRAHEWKENDEIVDGSGSPIIKIIQHKKFATPSGPGYSVSIGIPGSETVLAYLERSQEPSFKDHFHLITIAVHFQRNHDDEDEDDNGQQQDHAPRGRGEEIVQHIYGKLTQGVFGREYTYSRRSEDGNEYIPIMKAKNSRVTLSAFPGLYLPFLCKKFTLKFYSVKHPERLLFTRNQNERFVEFGSKISTTEAVCLAFAIDRMTNPCNCETLKSSQLAYKGNFNFKPGRILGGHW